MQIKHVGIAKVSDHVSRKEPDKSKMSSLLAKDQPLVLGRGVRSKQRQTYDQHRISPAIGDVGVTRINPALTAAPGKVRLADLNDGNWPKQLAEFLDAYGRTRSHTLKQTISDETLRHRTDILFSTFRLVTSDWQCKHVQTLAHFKPRLVRRIIELWSANGLSKKTRANYFSHIRWFWHICNIQIGPIATYDLPSSSRPDLKSVKSVNQENDGQEVKQIC